MMNAREMFEQLGYELVINEIDRVEYVCRHLKITFNNRHNFKTVRALTNVDMELHKAIHQQLKELKWLDE